MMLGVVGDRGQSASVTGEDNEGRQVIVDPLLVPRAMPRKPDLVKKPNGDFNVTLPAEQAAEFIDSLRRKHGEKVQLHGARVIREFPGQVNLNLELGGPEALRSCVKSALVLICWKGGPVAETCEAWGYVRGETEWDASRFSFTSSSAPWLPGPELGEVPHVLAAVADSTAREVKMHLRLFGAIDLCGLLAQDVDVDDWRAAYALDPLSGTEAFVDKFEGEIGRPIDKETLSEFYDAVEKRLARVDQIAGRLARDAMMSRVIESVLRSHDGEPWDEQTINKVASEISEEIATQLFRIGGTVDDADLLSELRRRLGETG
jgi:hypothetical protein